MIRLCPIKLSEQFSKSSVINKGCIRLGDYINMNNVLFITLIFLDKNFTIG